MTEYILTFHTTNAAVKAEQRLLEAGLAVGVMPLPGRIRAGCGICLRLKPEDLRRALDALGEEKPGLYSREELEGGYIYEEIPDGSDLWSES